MDSMDFNSWGPRCFPVLLTVMVIPGEFATAPIVAQARQLGAVNSI